MTVPNEVRVNVFQGDAVTLIYPLTYKLFKATDVEVRKRLSGENLGTGTLLTLDTDYSVSNLGEEFATVTLIRTIDGTDEIEMARFVPYTQETNILNQGGFFPKVLEDRYDENVMMIQQLDDTLTQNAQRHFQSIDTNEYAGDWDIGSKPADRINTYLGFDANGDAVIRSVPTIGHFFNFIGETIISVNGQTIFPLANDFTSSAFVLIFASGLHQISGWVLTSSDITFDEAFLADMPMTIYGDTT